MSFWKSLFVLICLTTINLSAEGSAKLSGWWSFESDSARVEDRSGNGLHGRANGCSRSRGRSGMALKLDGSSGITISDSPLLRGQRGFTLECWIKPDTAPGPARNIISKPMEYMLRVDPDRAGGRISLFVYCDGGWEPRVSGLRPVAGKWYHILASWDGTKARMWVNRISSASLRPGKCNPTDAPLVIGGTIRGLAGFSGLIDEVRVYSGAISPLWLTRMAYGMTETTTTHKRRDTRFEFQSGPEGWRGEDCINVATRSGALRATLLSDDSLLKVTGLAIDAEANPICTIRMSATGGERGVCVFVSDKMCREIPLRLLPDGSMHVYTLRCASWGLWRGIISAIGLRVDGAEKTDVGIDFIRLDKTSHAPPDLRILSLAPERRINALNKLAAVTAWVYNAGGIARDVTIRLSVPEGVTVQDNPDRTLPRVDFDERKMLTWYIRSRTPLSGNIRIDVTSQGKWHCAMVRPISFAKKPQEAAKELARSRAWLRAGYPRSMDFRHLFPNSITFLEHNTTLLVDLIDGKIEAAREFKQRYPDQLVLMQVNDELNGLWGSWHCVPREFAIKENLKCDPTIFPMPEFRGYWLLGPGAILNRDMPDNAETCEFNVPETKWFVVTRYGKKFLRDVLIYRRVHGKPDWNYSEYASVVKVNEAKKTITIRRWPKKAVGRWRSFVAGGAYVAPSIGSIYRLKDGPLIKTWVPNLTRFCPRDPSTGMDAVTWWARHFAQLWHERIAISEPHPDGFEFDGLNEGAIGDCNNDGIVDGCELGGINYWRLGIYDFFRKLRTGGDDWKGLGSALILTDASSVWSPRDLSLLNGSENEEFPSFSGPGYFPTGLDLYRVWCSASAAPSCSYLQGRFACDTYLDEDWLRAKSRGKFYDDSLVRLSIASACMGDGIYTFRTGSRRDIQATLSGDEILEYPWDEYYAGRRGIYNWLGLPLGEPVRMTEHLGGDLLPRSNDPRGWTLKVSFPGIRASGPEVTRVEGRQSIGVDVISIDTEGHPRANRVVAAERAILMSPETLQNLDAGKEYCVEFWIAADPRYDEKEGRRFANVWRQVGVCLRRNGHNGIRQWFLTNSRGRYVAMTLRPPERAPCRVAFLIGSEIGSVNISDLRVREGCAEIFYRRFENGLVLLNGSALSPYTFDTGKIDNRQYRRFLGVQAPSINNGQPVSKYVNIPARDGLLLGAE